MSRSKPFPMSEREVSLAQIDVDRGCIGADARGNLWCAGYEGIFRVSGGRVIHFSPNGDEDLPATASIAPGKDGEVYFGTNAGLLRYTSDGFRCYTEDTSPLHDDHIVYLWGNGDGRVFIVGYEGESERKHVTVFDGADDWTLFEPGHGLPNADIAIICLALDAAGNLLIGAEDGYWFQRAGVWVVDALDDPSPAVDQILRDGDALWLGTSAGVFRVQGGTCQHHETDLVQCLCRDGDVLWIGLSYGGVSRLAGGELTHVGEDEDVSGIVRTNDGRIWVHHDDRELARIEDGALVSVLREQDDED